MLTGNGGETVTSTLAPWNNSTLARTNRHQNFCYGGCQQPDLALRSSLGSFAARRKHAKVSLRWRASTVAIGELPGSSDRLCITGGITIELCEVMDALPILRH